MTGTEKCSLITRAIGILIVIIIVIFIVKGYGDDKKQIGHSTSSTKNKQPNAKKMRRALYRYKIQKNKAVNDYQKEKIEKRRENYITGYYAQDWHGKITRIGSSGEVKLDTEVPNIWLYFDISSDISKVGNWREGDIVKFSGRIGKLYILSYYIDIDNIQKM